MWLNTKQWEPMMLVTQSHGFYDSTCMKYRKQVKTQESEISRTRKNTRDFWCQGAVVTR